MVAEHNESLRLHGNPKAGGRVRASKKVCGRLKDREIAELKGSRTRHRYPRQAGVRLAMQEGA